MDGLDPAIDRVIRVGGPIALRVDVGGELVVGVVAHLGLAEFWSGHRHQVSGAVHREAGDAVVRILNALDLAAPIVGQRGSPIGRVDYRNHAASGIAERPQVAGGGFELGQAAAGVVLHLEAIRLGLGVAAVAVLDQGVDAPAGGRNWPLPSLSL